MEKAKKIVRIQEKVCNGCGYIPEFFAENTCHICNEKIGFTVLESCFNEINTKDYNYQYQ